MAAALGFGVSGPHGQSWFRERKLARLIARAIEGGVRHFDTAPFYGEAQARLGRALSEIGAGGIFVSTKTGTRREGARSVKDFSADRIRHDVEASLRSLHREALDMLYLHGPSPENIDAALPVLTALKAEGKTKAIGVCGEGPQLDHAVLRGFDAIMGVYNVIDRRHAGVFAQAAAQGMAVVAIAPLAQGAFAAPRPPGSLSDIWRMARSASRGAPPDARARMARAVLAGAGAATPNAAALAFVLQSGFISLALTTTANPAHLAESLAAARAPLSEAAMAGLSALSLDPAGGQP